MAVARTKRGTSRQGSAAAGARHMALRVWRAAGQGRERGRASHRSQRESFSHLDLLLLPPPLLLGYVVLRLEADGEEGGNGGL